MPEGSRPADAGGYHPPSMEPKTASPDDPTDPDDLTDQPLPRLRLLAGIAAAVAVGAVASAIVVFAPGAPSPLLIALVVGAAIANLAPGFTARVQPGSGALIGPLLRVGIILLGARGSFELIAAIGPQAILVVIGTMTAVFAFVGLAARTTNIVPALAVLLAVGTAVCGNTAIAAAAPLVRARRPEVALAIGTVTLFGTAAVILYPAIGAALGLDDRAFGIWAGAGVHDTSQVVATGFSFSSAAGEVATIVKLGRNTLMLPILVLLAVLYRGGQSRLGAARSSIVLVGGYGLMVAANSAGLLPEVVVRASAVISTWALTVAIAGVGLNLRLADLRVLGPPGVTVGFGASVIGGAVALALTLALQP